MNEGTPSTLTSQSIRTAWSGKESAKFELHMYWAMSSPKSQVQTTTRHWQLVEHWKLRKEVSFSQLGTQTVRLCCHLGGGIRPVPRGALSFQWGFLPPCASSQQQRAFHLCASLLTKLFTWNCLKLEHWAPKMRVRVAIPARITAAKRRKEQALLQIFSFELFFVQFFLISDFQMRFHDKASVWRLLLVILVLYTHQLNVHGDCSSMNDCNGHGTCSNKTSTCDCYQGWGASTDITYHRAPDCTARTCPSFPAWADLPTSASSAHALKECSNRGTCDTSTGECKCWVGFEGIGCHRMKCPNDCSKHGECLSMRQLARRTDPLPLGPATFYEGDDVSTVCRWSKYNTCFDKNNIHLYHKQHYD